MKTTKINLVEFCKNNKNEIIAKLKEKSITLNEDSDFITGYREVLDDKYNCTVVKDDKISSIMAKQTLVNNRLPFKHICIDFTLKEKKCSLEVNNKTLYYKIITL